MTPARNVVVITGASRGIGAQLSKTYRHIGHQVVAGSRSMCESDDPMILVIEGDITRPETGERILGTDAEPFGRPICGTLTAAVGDAASDRVPTAAIRHALRALASETGPLAGLRGVKLVRPLVAQAHEVLRKRLEAGGSVEAYLRGRARLADSAVVGLLHIASVSTRMRGNNMVVPLAAVAVGRYGRSELAPGSDLDLLFILPENGQSRAGAVAGATETCIKAVVAGLWDLGFVLDHTARSSRECLALARDEPSVLASLRDRRFLWGGFGLFAALDADLAGLFSGPPAARWRNAVGTALPGRAGDALNQANSLVRSVRRRVRRLLSIGAALA
jgi:hypothetical protein